MFNISADAQISPEFLGKYIGKHKALVRNRYQPLQDAYENRYDIYRLPKKPGWKTDNRVSINYAKYIVDTMSGFFMGVPVKTGSDKDQVKAYMELLDRYNDADDNNAELSKIADIHGRAYEMYFVDDSGNIGLSHLSPLTAFMIYDNSILERPLFFIRYYKDENGVEWGSWSDSTVVQHFVNHGSYQWVDEPRQHGFSGVPATEFVNNEECMGLFEGVLPAINQYNKALSEKCNDVDYFADAYLKILGKQVETDDLEFLRRNRIINFVGDTDGELTVDFLQKPNADATQENLIARLERLIFQISMVTNINDENFGTSSGIALRYRLASMSNLAQVKERKFTSGMNRRYKLIFSNPISRGHGVAEDDWLSVNYHFTRNYPVNVMDEAQTAQTLEGIVSKETQLKVLSIVDSPEAEMERMNKENEEAQKQQEERFGAAYGFNNPNKALDEPFLTSQQTARVANNAT